MTMLPMWERGGGVGAARDRSGLVVLLVVVGFGALVGAVWSLQERAGGDPVGSQDFVAYWSAYDVAVDGGNPYEKGELAASQQGLGLERMPETQRYWNPPWTLVVLAPVLALPFEVAVATWLVFGIAAALVSVWAAWRLLGPPDRPLRPAVLAGALAFLPLLESLRLGQLSTLMTALVLTGVLALHRRHDLPAGLLLGLVVVKPQTFLLVLVVVGIHVLCARRWLVVAGAIGSAAVLAGASALLMPSAFSAWDPVGGAPTHWHTATLVGWLRAGLDGAGGVPNWPLVVVPALAILLTLPWAWQRAAAFDPQSLPTLLVLSYLVAPYAWIFDATVLLSVQVAVLGWAVVGDGRCRVLIGVAFAIQVVALVGRSLPWTDQQHLVWLPIALLVVERFRLTPRRAEARRPLPVVADSIVLG